MNRRAIEAERRIQAGLPVLTCPNCGKREAHWMPDSLDDYELVVPGFFTCDRATQRPESTTELAIDSDLPAIAPLPISPDCRDGNKHLACSGDAWDFTTDTETVCLCSCHQIGVAA